MRLYPQIFTILFTFFVFFNNAYAQLCQGSLGDPVINITFGAGQNPGPALSSSITNYSFVTNVCPNDGMYTIANSTADCFNSTWHSLSEDHTPNDVNGYMMIVNASFEPGDFYVQQVDGLCENTTYEFAAWILNILRSTACGASITPNVTFNIESTSGDILKTFTTGDIPTTATTQWNQYGSFFITPVGTTSVVIRMTNNAPGGCGNDLLLDDITFRPCGPLVTVNINGTSKEENVCAGNTSFFSFAGNVSNGYNDPVYQWQISVDQGNTWADVAGADQVNYTRSLGKVEGAYQYRLAVVQRSNVAVLSCRVVSNVVTVNVNPLPVPAAANSGPGCTGEVLTLQTSGGSSFSWKGPQGFTSNEQNPVMQKADLNDRGKYYVKVTSDKGCINTDSTQVIINLSPVANAGNDADICEGKSTQLNGTGSNILFYNWSPSVSLSDGHIANPIASPTETTLYVFTALNGACQTADSITVHVSKKPVADAGPDKVIIRGQSATLNGVSGGDNVSYSWRPALFISSSSVLNPSINPPHDTSYILNVVSNIGCGTSSDTVLIKVFNDIYIPNAFTPNNDGKNDTWNIETLKAYPNAEIKVFNRYGEMIYNNNIKKQWDGKYKGMMQNAGVYCYMIDLKNGRKPLTGVVLIVL